MTCAGSGRLLGLTSGRIRTTLLPAARYSLPAVRYDPADSSLWHFLEKEGETHPLRGAQRTVPSSLAQSGVQSAGSGRQSSIAVDAA